MKTRKRFPFLLTENRLGEAGFSPFLPCRLVYGANRVESLGLLDTGASVNVLPFSIGQSLGLDWEAQNRPMNLVGNLASFEARGVIIDLEIEPFQRVRQAFAWTKSNEVPLIFGQTNFFMSFDVCFFRDELEFEISRKTI